MKNYKKIMMTFLVVISFYTRAQNTIIPVGQANFEKTHLFFEISKENRNVNKYVHEMKQNFSLYRSFFQVSHGLVPFKNVNYIVRLYQRKKNWVLMCSAQKKSGTQKDFRYEVERSFSQKKLANHLSHKLYQHLTKRDSIFDKKIFFTSSHPSRKGRVIKELYVMNFDGSHKKRLTYHNSLVLSPAISPDNKKIAYSLIDYRRSYIALYLYDRKTKQSKIISKRRGINSGAVFIDNKSLILTLTFAGNADLYIIDLNGNIKRKITSHYGIDVDPSITRDRKHVFFLSDRPGKAMIYSLQLSGGKRPRRWGYVGDFNATPVPSPTRDEVIFASWQKRTSFDLYRINLSGGQLYRLTASPNSYEGPSFSADGEILATTVIRANSAGRKDRKSVQLIDRNGVLLRNLTKGFGNCQTPRWSN